MRESHTHAAFTALPARFRRTVGRFLATTVSSTMATATRISAAPALALLGACAVPAASLAVASPAAAQFSRIAPSPVSAGDFAGMLRAAGIPKEVTDIALPLHEAYFAQFRDFEAREVEPTLERTIDPIEGFTRTVESAKEIRDTKRRLFLRASQFDAQLASDLAALLQPSDQPRAERLRELLARRRAISQLPAGSWRSGAESLDLAQSETIAALGPDRRAEIAELLANYGTELTRLLERAADAALEQPVKAVELRIERGLNSPPRTAEPKGDGGDAPGGAPAGQDAAAIAFDPEWFRALGEVQRDAGADVAAATRRIRRHQRDTVAQLEPLLPSESARALRAELIRKAYPMLRPKDAFGATVAEIEGMRSKGSLDPARAAAVEAAIAAHDLAERPILQELMDLADERAASGAFAFVPLAGDAESPDGAVKAAERRTKLTDDLDALATRDAVALREAAGLAPLEAQVARGGGGDDIVGRIAEAVESAVSATVDAQAVMIGGDGEMIAISGDELGDAGVFFSGVGDFGGSQRVVKSLTGSQLDRLAATCDLDGDRRVVFDEIFAQCVEARRAAEEANQDAAPPMMQSEDGSFTITLSVVEDGGMFSPPTDKSALIAAIDAAEETLFNGLRAAAATDRADAIERARRARARERLLVGETGAHAVDLLAVADAAELSDAARAKADAALASWDESSVALLRAMRAEVAELTKRREELMEGALREVTSDDGKGSVSVNRSIEISGETGEALEKIDRGLRDAQAKVADANRRALDATIAALEGDGAAARAMRRGYLRAANPAIYRLPRDLGPCFAKADAVVAAQTGREAIAQARAAWIEEREARCERYLAEREAEERAGVALDLRNDPNAAIKRMQLDMRERRRLREDIEQLEATAFRGLRDIVEREAGAEGLKELGELPSRPKRNAPMIRFGG